MADMTTPTPHGAPELTNADLVKATGAILSDWGVTFSFEELDAYTRAAIQQAAGAVPEGAMDYALDILVAAGHITREKAFQTRDITRQFYAGSSDHLVPCAGGGVTQPPSDEQIDAALASLVACGETVQWYLEQAFSEDAPNVREIMVREIVRVILAGSAPREDA